MERLDSKKELEPQLKLVRPSAEYKDSFIKSVIEFQGEGRDMTLNVDDLNRDFESYLEKKRKEALGIDLKEGYVPSSSYWLIDGGEYIGTVHVRTELNEDLMKKGGNIGYAVRSTKRQMGYGTKILELALTKAKESGLDRVLITCDDDNIGSAKIIESNGGVLENKAEVDGILIRRYWIDINQSTTKQPGSNKENEPSSVLEREVVKDFIDNRRIKEEDWPLIERLAAFPKSHVIEWFHNWFNDDREKSGESLNAAVNSSFVNPKQKEMCVVWLELYQKYDWAVCYNLVRVLERL